MTSYLLVAIYCFYSTTRPTYDWGNAISASVERRRKSRRDCDAWIDREDLDSSQAKLKDRASMQWVALEVETSLSPRPLDSASANSEEA